MNIIANRERPVPVHGSGTAVCQAEHSLCGYEARIALFINVLRPGDTPEKKCGRSHGVGWRRSPPIIPETRQLPVALCVLEAVGMAGGGEGKRENKCEAHALARFQHSGRASLADNPLKNNRTKQLSANIVPAAAALAPAGPAAPPKISLPTTVSVGPFLNIPKAGDLKPISV